MQNLFLLTSMLSTPICKPDDLSKFPSRLRYSYLHTQSLFFKYKYKQFVCPTTGLTWHMQRLCSSSIWLNAERRIQYSPGHSALPQCLLHIHVIALEVYDDHTEILILGLTVQELHIWDKLLHPASLILYCHRRQLRWVAMKP